MKKLIAVGASPTLFWEVGDVCVIYYSKIEQDYIRIKIIVIEESKRAGEKEIDQVQNGMIWWK